MNDHREGTHEVSSPLAPLNSWYRAGWTRDRHCSMSSLASEEECEEEQELRQHCHLQVSVEVWRVSAHWRAQFNKCLHPLSIRASQHVKLHPLYSLARWPVLDMTYIWSGCKRYATYNLLIHLLHHLPHRQTNFSPPRSLLCTLKASLRPRHYAFTVLQLTHWNRPSNSP